MGRAHGARSRRPRLPLAAPLRRAPVRARRGAEHAGAQARLPCARSSACCSSTAIVAANPADLLAAPKQPQRLPRTLKAADVAALLDRIPAAHAARAARPRAVRARLRVRPARGGAGRPGRRLGRLRRRAGPRGGQGRQDALRALRGARAAVAHALPGARPRHAGRRSRPSPRCSSPSPAGGSRRPTCAAACAPGRGTPRPRAPSTRTPCGTPSRPICWRAEPTSGSSRSSWGTPRMSTTQVYTRVESARLRAAYARSHPRA